MAIQVPKELLDGSVLALLAKEDSYGYEITQNIVELLSVSESTLYPVLKRLKDQDQVSTYDKEYSGRNRRYYSITHDGMVRFSEIKNGWEKFSDRINKLFYK